MSIVGKRLSKWRKKNEARLRETKYTVLSIVKSPTPLFGLVLVVFMFLVAVLADVLAVYPNVTRPGQFLLPPSLEHLFGTDDLGRDVFARVVHGSRISLYIGFAVVAISMPIGVLIGLASGYLGGKADELSMRVTDIFLSIPSLVFAILIMAVLGPSVNNAILAIAITLWPRYARLTRGTALSVRETLFVEAARSYSAGDLRIMFRHILPNTLAPLTVQASFDIGTGILTAASLGFIGLGVPPPTPEWGALISYARTYLPDYWWYAFFPGMAIVLSVLGFNLLGDGLRDALDPRLRQ